MATSNNSDTVITASGHIESIRQNAYTRYYHQGLNVCATMFRFLHGVGRKRMKNLARSYKVNGLTPRIHGNSKRPLSSAEFVVRFLLHSTRIHGLLLPGGVPGYSRSDLNLLPSSATKRLIWTEYYQSATNDSSIYTVEYSTFCRLWRTLLPQVLIMKPMSDLCWQCQQNSTAIIRSANSQECDKSSTLKAAEDHLRHVQLERLYYRAICDDCRQDVQRCFTEAPVS